MELNGCHVIAARSTHAVQAASFVLELPAQISIDIAQNAIKHYENSPFLKELFPVKSENQAVSIDLTGEQGNVKHTSSIDGFTLQRVSPEDGSIEFSFVMQTNQVIFTCNKYSRWNDVSSQALTLFGEFLSFICPIPGIAVVGLQYVDEFFITGNKEEFKPSIIFSPNNSRLPSSLLNANGFWHNHSGWFGHGPLTTTTDDRVLNNLNISVYPQLPDRDAVQFITAHRLMLKTPISDKNKLVESLPVTFEMLHSANKDLFREILNQETLESIKLFKE